MKLLERIKNILTREEKNKILDGYNERLLLKGTGTSGVTITKCNIEDKYNMIWFYSPSVGYVVFNLSTYKNALDNMEKKNAKTN